MTETITGRGRVTVTPFVGSHWLAYTQQGNTGIVATMDEFDLWQQVRDWERPTEKEEMIAFFVLNLGWASKVIKKPGAVTLERVDWRLSLTGSHDFAVPWRALLHLRTGVLEVGEDGAPREPATFSSDSVKSTCICGMNKNQRVIDQKRGYSVHGTPTGECPMHGGKRFHGLEA